MPGRKSRVEPTPSTRMRLFGASRHICAFPSCEARLVTETGSMVGQACHIKAESPGGPRYDPYQTDEQRRSFSNLIALCSNHHREIDDPARLDEFTVERLQTMKGGHERGGPDLQLELRREDEAVLGDVPYFIVSLLARNTGPQIALDFTFQLGLPFLPLALCPIVGDRRPCRPVVGRGQPAAYWVEFQSGEKHSIRFFSPPELKLRPDAEHVLAQLCLPTSWYGLLLSDGRLRPAEPELRPEPVVYACPFTLMWDRDQRREGCLPLDLYRLVPNRS